MTISRKLRTIACVCVCACTCLSQAQKLLTTGDPAPPIKVAAWLKGEPVTTFKEGTVYVLDFWATWCGPCNASMPHMSEIARKFRGRAEVIGVDVSEQPKQGTDLTKMVAEFVKRKGDNMDYSVCMDDMKSQPMNKSYCQAAKMGGIPAVFIIDQNGKIADMIVGFSPGDHSVADDVKQLIDGTFDHAAAAARSSKRQEGERKYDEFLKAIDPIYAELTKTKDYPRVLQMLDDLYAKDPAIEESQLNYSRYILDIMRFGALAHVDANKAFDLAVKAKGTVHAAYIAQAFEEQDGLPKRFYDYSVEIFEDSKAKFPDYPDPLLAQAYYRDGRPAKAVEQFQKYIDFLKIKAPNANLDGPKKRLKIFQDAAAKSAG